MTLATAGICADVRPAVTSDPTLHLTFDDGPDLLWTERVLDELEALKVTATFFAVGTRVKANPQVTRKVLDAGHQVELHCHRHVRHSQLSEDEVRRDTEEALEVLGELSVRPTLWRPPWGVVAESTLRVAAQFGLGVRRWEIDTHDWRGDSPSLMLADALPLIGAGGSVLMHDAIGPGATRDNCANTVELLAGLIDSARAASIAVGPMTTEQVR